MSKPKIIPEGVRILDVTDDSEACRVVCMADGCVGIRCDDCALYGVEALAEAQADVRSGAKSPDLPPIEYETPEVTEEHTGGSSSYYGVKVSNPTTLPAPYDAECNDIIEALGMTFAEGNAFKAIWRTATARLGKKKVGNNAFYDAEKVVFFGERMKVHASK
jgi:hypothetical protein